MIGHDLQAALPELRAAAESTMADTFEAFAPNAGGQVPDGQLESTYPIFKGTTRGKLAGTSRQSDTVTRTVLIGDTPVPVVEAGLHLPVSAAAPTAGGYGVGWEYVLTVPGPLTPAELVGSRWLVVDAPAKTFMTARRLDVVQLQGGAS